MAALSKEVRNLSENAHLKPLLCFRGGNEAKIRCSWVWNIAVETGVACHFEFYFDQEDSGG